MTRSFLPALLAYHDGHGGGGGGGVNLVTGVVVLGLFATAALVFLSGLGTRATVGIATGGWAVALGLLFVV